MTLEEWRREMARQARAQAREQEPLPNGHDRYDVWRNRLHTRWLETAREYEAGRRDDEYGADAPWKR